MSEKSLLGPIESLGQGILKIIAGIGAVALGLHFFNKSSKSDKTH